MYFILGLLIVLLALYFIAAPFLDEEEIVVADANLKAEKVSGNSNEAFAKSIEEIEADYHMGKISKEDYEALKAEYIKKNEVNV